MNRGGNVRARRAAIAAFALAAAGGVTAAVADLLGADTFPSLPGVGLAVAAGTWIPAPAAHGPDSTPRLSLPAPPRDWGWLRGPKGRYYECHDPGALGLMAAVAPRQSLSRAIVQTPLRAALISAERLHDAFARDRRPEEPAVE